MKNNEWTTIQTLLGLEIDKATKKYRGTIILPEILNHLYFDWTHKVIRHIRIQEDLQPDTTEQEREIMQGIAETQGTAPLTEEELEIMTQVFRTLRKIK